MRRNAGSPCVWHGAFCAEAGTLRPARPCDVRFSVVVETDRRTEETGWLAGFTGWLIEIPVTAVVSNGRADCPGG